MSAFQIEKRQRAQLAADKPKPSKSLKNTQKNKTPAAISLRWASHTRHRSGRKTKRIEISIERKNPSFPMRPGFLDRFPACFHDDRSSPPILIIPRGPHEARTRINLALSTGSWSKARSPDSITAARSTIRSHRKKILESVHSSLFLFLWWAASFLLALLVYRAVRLSFLRILSLVWVLVING